VKRGILFASTAFPDTASALDRFGTEVIEPTREQ
jgi:hypothetical protein